MLLMFFSGVWFSVTSSAGVQVTGVGVSKDLCAGAGPAGLQVSSAGSAGGEISNARSVGDFCSNTAPSIGEV
ncbi:hypothetical protein ACOSQ3_033022 [Xanthoceras sorbifolium]